MNFIGKVTAGISKNGCGRMEILQVLEICLTWRFSLKWYENIFKKVNCLYTFVGAPNVEWFYYDFLSEPKFEYKGYANLSKY